MKVFSKVFKIALGFTNSNPKQTIFPLLLIFTFY